MESKPTVAENIQNECGASGNARKLESAQKQINKNPINRRMSQGQRSQLKELPLAKAGTI